MSGWFRSSSSLFHKGLSEAVFRGCKCKPKKDGATKVRFSGSVDGFSTRDTALQVWAQQGWQAGALGNRMGQQRGEEGRENNPGDATGL